MLILFVRRRLTPRMGEVQPCEGIVPVVRDLHRAGHKLFVLTSNYKENVQIFLRQHNIDRLFEGVDTVHFASVGTKKRALKKLIRRNNLDPSDCYYVGNEALDVEAAERVGIRGIATAWGGFNHEALKKTAPFAILERPKELVGLLQ